MVSPFPERCGWRGASSRLGRTKQTQSSYARREVTPRTPARCRTEQEGRVELIVASVSSNIADEGRTRAYSSSSETLAHLLKREAYGLIVARWRSTGSASAAGRASRRGRGRRWCSAPAVSIRAGPMDPLAPVTRASPSSRPGSAFGPSRQLRGEASIIRPHRHALPSTDNTRGAEYLVHHLVRRIAGRHRSRPSPQANLPGRYGRVGQRSRASP